MSSKDPRISVAIVIMQERFVSGVSLDALAMHLNLSSSRLRHLLKRETGLSATGFIRSLRMERAKELLISSFLSVKEIMAQVGYGDLSHFVRDFKTVTGMSPRRYRMHFHHQCEKGERELRADGFRDAKNVA